MKRQAIDWGKNISHTYISDKGHIVSSIYKEFPQINNEKIDDPMWVQTSISTSQKRILRRPIGI